MQFYVKCDNIYKVLGVVYIMEDLTQRELMSLIEKLVDEKIEKDENFLKFSFYEVRVKGQVTNKQETEFLRLIKNKLNNMRYIVYLQNEEFIYNGLKTRVQLNELLVAVKESA